MPIPKTKLSVLLFLLFIFVLCTLTPSFEGMVSGSSTVYNETEYDSADPTSKASPPTGMLDTGLTSATNTDFSSSSGPQSWSNVDVSENTPSEVYTPAPMPPPPNPNQPPPDYTDMDSEGIPYDDIPPGQDNLYILKSKIVPPVCPACPSVCASKDKAPPCPACERCPEPKYDCKLVPNYESAAANPMPMLNDFSAF